MRAAFTVKVTYMKIEITPRSISSEEFLTLAREAEFKACWQVSECNADKLFG